MERKILLVGVNLRSFFSWARFFRENGFLVYCIDAENIDVEKSKFVDKYIKVESPKIDLDNFLESLTELFKDNVFSFIIPVNDLGIEILELFLKNSTYEFNYVNQQIEQVRGYAHNKLLLYEESLNFGFESVDTTVLYQEKDIQNSLEKLNKPVFIRPIYSRIIEDKKLIEESVKYCKNSDTARNYLRDNFKINYYMIQESFDGIERGFNFFSENGKVLEFYVDEVVFSNVGQESGIRRSVNETDSIIIKFKNLIEHIGWNGIGMFDYRLNEKTGEVFLIELNGRLWASYDLCEISGMSFLNSLVFGHKSSVDQGTYLLKKQFYLVNLKKFLEIFIGHLKTGNFKLGILSISLFVKILLFKKSKIQELIGKDFGFWIKYVTKKIFRY